MRLSHFFGISFVMLLGYSPAEAFLYLLDYFIFAFILLDKLIHYQYYFNSFPSPFSHIPIQFNNKAFANSSYFPNPSKVLTKANLGKKVKLKQN